MYLCLWTREEVEDFLKSLAGMNLKVTLLPGGLMLVLINNIPYTYIHVGLGKETVEEMLRAKGINPENGL